MGNYGRLTVNGSKHFEEKLSLVLDAMAADINTLVDDSLYEAIILIGGYGRGEGGVIKVDGVELPHNNFDFVVVTKNISSEETSFLEQLCKTIFNTHSKKLGIEVEFSVLSLAKIKRIDPLVITYDMKYGHKLIAGNNDFLVNESRFELESIPSWDVRNLMVNRGTLLIINDLILQKESLSKKDEKIIVKHWIKAIIGYGDALLYYLGRYDYSYVEKQKRMQRQTAVSNRFKALYDKAMNFRFQPNYKRYEKFNLKKYQQFIKEELQKIHYQCEDLALDCVQVESMDYINKAMDQSLDDNSTLKGNIKKVLSLVKTTPKVKKFNFLENLKYKMVGIQGMMPILFPFIAFDIRKQEFNGVLQDFFQTNIEQSSLKNQYLVYWKNYVNSNFVREDFGI